MSLRAGHPGLPVRPLTILLVSPRGFCAGVHRAIHVVEEALAGLARGVRASDHVASELAPAKLTWPEESTSRFTDGAAATGTWARRCVGTPVRLAGLPALWRRAWVATTVPAWITLDLISDAHVLSRDDRDILSHSGAQQLGTQRQEPMPRLECSITCHLSAGPPGELEVRAAVAGRGAPCGARPFAAQGQGRGARAGPHRLDDPWRCVIDRARGPRYGIRHMTITVGEPSGRMRVVLP